MQLIYKNRSFASVIYQNIFPHQLNPSVAIVILNWNGYSFLETFLPSVLDSGYPNMKVYVVDNASTDRSLELLATSFPTVSIICNDRNYGFAGGYNEGLKHIEADYYMLLNSDVEVTRGWLGPMVAQLESDPGFAACQPKILQYADKALFEYAGAAGGYIDRFGYPFARGRIFDYCEKDAGQYDSTTEVFWASGAALMIRSRCYHEMKGFDSWFFAHMEEIDLCWRLQQSGYRIFCVPASTVYHVGGGTLPKGNERKVYLNFRNNLVMMAKNLPLGQAILKIGFRFILDLVSASKSLLAGQFTYFTAVIRAHWGFLGWLFREQRTAVFPAQKRSDWRGYYRGSVVWQHFVQGQKKFSEIVKKFA